jgi:hypothetical protein
VEGGRPEPREGLARDLACWAWPTAGWPAGPLYAQAVSRHAREGRAIELTACSAIAGGTFGSVHAHARPETLAEPSPRWCEKSQRVINLSCGQHRAVFDWLAHVPLRSQEFGQTR